MKYMTYCEFRKKEIKNDEWRKHIFSDKHLTFEAEKFCKLCDMKYNPSLDADYEHNKTRIDIAGCHEHGPIHKRNDTRVNFNGR